MNRFEGKTVLVTGGNSGIGLATAQAFAAEGARVVITGRDESSLATARESLGANALAIRNVTGTVESARELAHRLADANVRLDAVFVNAGVARFAPFTDIDEQAWDETFAINVKGPYFQIQSLVPLLNEGASIVLNGSINAHIGMPMSSIYAASKAAFVSFAKTLSAELPPRGVRVNVVSPPGHDAAARQARPRRRSRRATAQPDSARPLRQVERSGGDGVASRRAGIGLHRRHGDHHRRRHEPALSPA